MCCHQQPQQHCTTTLNISLLSSTWSLGGEWREEKFGELRGEKTRSLVTGVHLTCSWALSACPASLCLPGAGASSSLCSCSWSSRGRWAWQLSSWGWVWPPLSRRSASPLPRPLGAGLGTVLGGASLVLGEAWLWKLGGAHQHCSEKVLLLELQTIHRFSQSLRRPLLGK